jgi:lipopolysaccharide transport system permease protein
MAGIFMRIEGSRGELAATPWVTLRPRRGWKPLQAGELWAHRELLYFLTWRDVKVRYRQTVLGAAWAILQPLATMLIFTLLFGRLARMPSDGVPYPLFAYAGLLPWTFFSTAVSNSGNSLVGSAHLITKVYFPRIVIPAATVGAALVDFAVAFLVLVGLMAWYRVAPSWQVALVPGLVALTGLLALGVGMWSSAVNVKYRDVRYALPFVIQLWMFATPVIYPATLVPERWRWLLTLNPLTGIVEAFRASLFGRPLDWGSLAISAVMTGLVLLYAAHAFRRMEASFADFV